MPSPSVADRDDDLTPTARVVLDQLEMWGQKLGLERIQATLEALGRPDRNFAIVLVGGTNGKGSTATLLASILSSAGYKSGLFTSPHLQSVRERIRVDGVAISPQDLSTALERTVAAAQKDSAPLPSYFEAVTAAALLHFAACRVDIAVLEVGLGGRLDATNATDPTLSIITSIGHDHQEHLGKRLDQIAAEKAGIARPGRPLLTWAPGQGGVQRVLRDVAAHGALVEESWRFLRVTSRTLAANSEGAGQEIDVESLGAPDGAPRTRSRTRRYQATLRLAGEHQARNAALAIRAAEYLARGGWERIDAGAIESGLERCLWPGRLELVRLDLDRNGTHRYVLLDGAHNPAAARALASYLERRALSGQEAPDLVFGSVRGKQAGKTLVLLRPHCRKIWITQPTNSRALPATDLARQLLGGRNVGSTPIDLVVEPSAPAALARAFDTHSSAPPEERQRAVLVCGSLYLVGETRTWLYRSYGAPAPAAEIDLFASAD